MKKYILLTGLLFCFDSLSLAGQPDVDYQKIESIALKNNKTLQSWLDKHHIKGRIVRNEKEFKTLPGFPQNFIKNKVRIVKYNGVMTMDYSYDRITVVLDKHGKIAEVNFG